MTNADLIWQEITNLLPGTYVVTAYAVGQVYLVKAKDGSKSCYEFGNVLVDMTTVGTRSLADGNNLRGTYRQVLTTHPVWVLQEDGKTCHRVDAPADLKAFGGYIEKE